MKTPVSASVIYNKWEFTTLLKMLWAPTRGCTEKPQTVYFSMVNQLYQWTAVGELVPGAGRMVLCVHCRTVHLLRCLSPLGDDTHVTELGV